LHWQKSAGGSAVQARDPKSQAIYRLRGKILKTQDVDLATILKNKEISDIVNILGCNIGKNFDYSKLKYDRIIIAADADVDGLHITVLVLTLFINFMPELIQKGHVYIATPPLFKIIEGKKEIFIQNKVDYSKYILNKIDSLYDIGLIKNNKVSLLKTFNDFDYSNYRKDIESIALKYSCNKSLIEWIIFNDITKNNPFIELDVNNNILEGMINDSFQYLDIDKIDKNDIDTIKTKYPDAINLRIRKKNDKFKSNFNLYDDILTVLNTTEPKHRTRFKGIGEMTPEQLATSTLDIRTRKLIQVTINDINDANYWFHCLMNDKAEPRKQFVKDYQYLIDKNDIEM
jgi:DNA gyrase subunit B